MSINKPASKNIFQEKKLGLLSLFQTTSARDDEFEPYTGVAVKNDGHLARAAAISPPRARKPQTLQSKLKS